MKGLAHKVAVVAGGGGIGSAVAERLGAEGASVVIGDLDLAAAVRVARDVEAAGGVAMGVAADLTNPSSVHELFAATLERFERVDLMHANAADLSVPTYGADTDLVEAPLELFDHTMAVNLRGHLLCTRAAIPLMLRQGSGSIVYTSSLAAFVGNQRAFYSMSKAALASLARSVAYGWGRRGIRSNVVAPGFVPTAAVKALPTTAAGSAGRNLAQLTVRPALTSDIADAVAYLLSDEAAMVQGHTLHVNGGSYLG